MRQISLRQAKQTSYYGIIELSQYSGYECHSNAMS